MIMFENNKTNQQLILMGDNHAIPNSKQLELMRKWKPLLLLIETEPISLQQILKFHEKLLSSKLSMNDMNNLGDIALKQCVCSAIALKEELCNENLFNISWFE